MIYLFNPYLNKLLKQYPLHVAEVLDVSICPDNSSFVSAGADRAVFLADVLTGKVLAKFSGHTQRVNCCDFNEDGNVVASGSYDSSLRLWDCKSSNRTPLQILDEANDSVSSVQMRGYEILTSSIDGHVRIYDIRMASLIDDNLTVPTTFACFSRDQNTILANSLDANIRLLDKSTGNLLNEYAGHKNEKYKLDCCFAANDAVVIAGSEDSAIYIWDLIDAKIISTLSSHTLTVTSVSVHPSLPYLLSASVDGLIKLWGSEAS